MLLSIGAFFLFTTLFANPKPHPSHHPFFDVSFDNIAAINSTAEVSGITISVRGFYSPGDGGGGSFYWSASSNAPTVPGMIIQIGSDPGRLIRIYTPGLVNVLWFGAHGDGVHDDAPAFNAAVATANTVVIVPNPSVYYKISSQIGLNKSGVTINGSDKVNTKIISDIHVKTVFFIGYNSCDITIQKVSLQNTDTATVSNTTGACIKAQLDTAFDGVMGRIDTNIVIKDCKFSGRSGYTDGVDLIAHRSGFGGTIRNVVIDHCDFDSLGAVGMQALGETNVEYFSNISITNNKFLHCGLNNPNNGFAVSVGGLGTNILADHNYVNDAKLIGIEFAGLSFSTLSNNVFEHILSPAGPNTIPYSVNNRNSPVGINNSVINNVVKDSVPNLSTFVNQSGFRSVGNVQKSFTGGLYIDSVSGSFTGDKYTYLGSGGPAAWVRSTSATFDQVILTGNSGETVLLKMTDSAMNNTFQNCFFSGYTAQANLASIDAGSINNRFLDCYSGLLKANLYDVNIPVTTGNSYTVEVHANDSTRKQVTLPSLATALGVGIVGTDSTITITTGSSSTVTNGYNIVRFNPTTLLSSYTLTLPTQWHSTKNLIIAFTPNASIPRGSTMVTTLTIVSGSGQTLSQAVDPTTAKAGDAIVYHLIGGTVDQRTN